MTYSETPRAGFCCSSTGLSCDGSLPCPCCQPRRPVPNLVPAPIPDGPLTRMTHVTDAGKPNMHFGESAFLLSVLGWVTERSIEHR